MTRPAKKCKQLAQKPRHGLRLMTGISDWRCEVCSTRYVVGSLVADCLTRHEKDALHITD